MWATDITYIPLARGSAYLVAIMDWHSRRVLSWRLSNTLDASFCVEALQEALSRFGQPEIFNSDQGSQFTAADFTDVLLAAGVKISMDGKGRCIDNVFVERLWRSLKYEDVYLKAYTNLVEARAGIARYFQFYNTHRSHQALGHQTPAAFYDGLAGPGRLMMQGWGGCMKPARLGTGLWKLPPLWTSETDRSPTTAWKTLRVSHSSHSPIPRSPSSHLGM